MGISTALTAAVGAVAGGLLLGAVAPGVLAIQTIGAGIGAGVGTYLLTDVAKVHF